MKFKLVCVFAVFALAALPASAQTKQSFAGKCGKPEGVQTIPAGDKEGHVFMIQQGKCETTSGEMEGVKSKDGSFAEHGENSATRTQSWGLYTETYENGDKVFYDYHTTGSVKDGNFTTGGNTYRIIGGTGKMKGIKGSGSCKLKGTADGGLDFNCTGEYTVSAAKAPAKKKS